jgi:outer membrane receptor protein involved in Fe transport
LKKIVLLSFLLLSSFLIKAQPAANLLTGKIDGIILDSIDRQPIEYATIALFLQNENKIINGTTSDTKGNFILSKVPQGTYRVVINFLGYEKKVLENVIVNEKTSSVSLGTILLAPKSTNLQGVTVTAQKNIIENKIDKLVYNAENDITSQTGVATDVLKKVPQVSVDINGNVELQGNANIRFLIDGKPSTIYGNSIVDVLQSIPASQIQSVEVITSPGAKYDAEGTGGIINILLKKTRINGISGNVSLSAGTRLENGSANLNARTGHFGVNAFVSGNAQLESNTITDQEQWTQNPGNSSHLLQHNESKFQRNGYQTGLGFDWSITPKDNINGGVTYNHWENQSKGVTNQNSLTYDSTGAAGSEYLNNLNLKNNYHSNSLNWNLNYKRTFKRKGQELNIQYNSGYSMNYSDYTQTQSQGLADTIYSGIYGTNPGTDLQTNISADYTQPIGEKASIETGVKAVLENLKSNSDVSALNLETGNYIPDLTQTYSLNYIRNIYAVYLTGTFSLFHFLDVKPGVRVEHTDTRIIYVNVPEISIPSYNTIVPSLVFSHSFKNNHTIKLSYSYRIERPDYRDLNPFINLSDPHNISTGNPDLKPEIGNSIELGYNKSFKKGGNINVVGYYRWNVDDIQNFVTYYPFYKIGDSTYADVSVSTRENISSDQRIGGNLYGSVPIVSVINIRGNISMTNHIIKNGGTDPTSINSFEYRVTLNASWQIIKSLALEVFGNFNSARTTAQGKNPSWSSYSIAIRQKLFKDKGSIAVTASNPFNEFVYQKSDLTGENFTLTSNRKIAFQSFGINFTYKFGKMKFRNEREQDNNMMEGPGF